jgi:hypothetical protein
MSTTCFIRAMQKLLLILPAVCLIFPAPAVAEDPLHLTYNFKDDYSQKFKCEYSQSMDFYGRNIVILIEAEITESCVEVLGDTAYRMEVVFDEVSSSMTVNDDLMPNNFDEAFKGQTISYQVDKSGEVSDVKAKSYIEGWHQFGQTVNDVMAGCYPDLPKKAAKAGDKWEEELTENPKENPGLEVVTKTTYEFKGVKKEKGCECAEITTKSESTFQGVIASPGGELDTNGETKSETQFYFDLSGGGIVKFKVKTQTDAKMVKKANSPGVKDEESELHRSFEIKKELK